VPRLLLVLAIGWALPAFAGPVEDAALKAHAVVEANCADIAGPTATMTSALAVVAPVLDEVSRTYEQYKEPSLLFWRGVLLACLSNEEPAKLDLETFAADPGNQRFLPDLVRDAERRLRQISRGGTGGAAAPSGLEFGPAATVSVGGGYDGLLTPAEGHHYGSVGVEGSIGIVGPLRAVVFGRFGVGTPHDTPEPQRSGLIPFGAGLAARLGDPIAFRAAVRFEATPNTLTEHGGPLLPGVTGVFGGAFQLGEAPLELRPEVGVGVLGTYAHLMAGVSVGVRLGE